MANKWSESTTSRKQTIVHLVTTVLGITLATLLERFGFGIVGWFIGGLVMGSGALFAYRKRGERWTAANVSIVVFTGVVVASVFACSAFSRASRVFPADEEARRIERHAGL